jgi:hypothetical protein
MLVFLSLWMLDGQVLSFVVQPVGENTVFLMSQ